MKKYDLTVKVSYTVEMYEADLPEQVVEELKSGAGYVKDMSIKYPHTAKFLSEKVPSFRNSGSNDIVFDVEEFEEYEIEGNDEPSQG